MQAIAIWLSKVTDYKYKYMISTVSDYKVIKIINNVTDYLSGSKTK